MDILAHLATGFGAALTPVGEFALRGFDAPQTVFGLADEATASTDSGRRTPESAAAQGGS